MYTESILTTSTTNMATTVPMTPRRRVRRRASHPHEITISSDDTWMYTDECLDDLIMKYEFRVKALNIEKKRRLMLAEKIIMEAVSVYCAKTVTTTLYNSQEW